jgi:hypothetical protein
VSFDGDGPRDGAGAFHAVVPGADPGAACVAAVHGGGRPRVLRDEDQVHPRFPRGRPRSRAHLLGGRLRLHGVLVSTSMRLHC